MAKESDLMTVPARKGRAARLTTGQAIKIINTHGTQVIDTWAFSAEDLREFMSMEHMRPTIGTIFPPKAPNPYTTPPPPILHFHPTPDGRSFIARRTRPPASTTR